ncbi:hypothetical protein DFH08DRAFT_655029, partial [Mycena albidolilacea]
PAAKGPVPKEWILKARKALEVNDFGTSWSELVGVWYSREESKGFVAPVSHLRHPAKLRPAQVGAWVQRARTGTPTIPDVERFAAAWAAWWQDINPVWRKTTLPMPRTEAGPWTSMDYPGPNGFLNVLMCLMWWRERVENAPGAWKEAVEDVMWVLKRMNG